MAILAGGLVVGIGGAATLAVWTDTEWVYGGNGAGGPGVGTSTFEVEQNVTKQFDATGTYASSPTNPGNSLVFGPGALALTPGDVVYAPVALRTTSDSVAGTLQLMPAVAATGITIDDPDGYLWDSLTLAVGFATTTGVVAPPTCDAAGFASYTAIAVSGTGLGGTPAVGTQALLAASGDIQHYCFRITMPTTLPGPTPALDDLQGLTVAPAWLFNGTSTP